MGNQIFLKKCNMGNQILKKNVTWVIRIFKKCKAQTPGNFLKIKSDSS